jgi:hypothetical protein
MNFNILQLIKIASVISLPVFLSDAQAQEFEPKLGETYFKVDQMVSFELGSNEPHFEGIITPQSRISHSSKILRGESNLPLEIGDSIDFQSSQNALRTLTLSKQDFEIPFAFELTHSDLLLARWNRDFPSYATTELLPSTALICEERPSGHHFELVWTSSGFELRSYPNVTTGRRCGSPPPRPLVIQTEVIPLTVESYRLDGSNLVLVPKQQPRLLPFFVILSNHGTARMAVSPEFDILFPASNLDNNNSTTWNSDYFAVTTVVD